MEEITKLAANEDTICAIATALGVGAIGIIRLSGPEALAISQEIFQAASGKKIQAYPSHTMIYGKIVDEKMSPIEQSLSDVRNFTQMIDLNIRLLIDKIDSTVKHSEQ